MPLTINVRFLLNRFDASDGHDRTPPEWPPAPARLFMALVAASEACGRRAHEALTWVATLPPPTIYADEATIGNPDRRWLVTNKVEKDGGSARHPGRTPVGRPRLSRYLRSAVVTFEWPDAEPDPSHLKALQVVADRVSYLGRPTSPAILEVSEAKASSDEKLAYVPTVSDERVDLSLRVPYPGFLDDLCAAYPGRVEPAVRHRYLYPQRETKAPEELFPSRWANVVALPLVSRAFVPGERALQVAHACRELIAPMSNPDVPASLSGTDRATPHCALLPLLHVGAPYADGHLLGVALAVPTLAEAPRNELWRYLRKLLDAEHRGKLAIKLPNVAGYSELCFEEQPDGRVPWGARSARWSDTARTWRTVIPAVLDKAPSHKLAEEEAALLSICNAGFPEPSRVLIARGPFRRGDVKLKPSQTITSPEGRRRPYRHLLITWSRPIQGPVIVGALRHLGLGICIPHWEEQDGAS
jgi:CRISPR-associated protein Csb2